MTNQIRKVAVTVVAMSIMSYLDIDDLTEVQDEAGDMYAIEEILDWRLSWAGVSRQKHLEMFFQARVLI